MEARIMGGFNIIHKFLSMRPQQFALCSRNFNRGFQSKSQNVRSEKSQSSRFYGQPVATTHPHLLSNGQLTPGLMKEEFQHRRTRLMESIGKCNVQSDKTKCDRHLIVIPSAVKSYMSEKIPYIFHQNTDFLYATGFLEPNSVLVLETVPGKSLPTHKSVIFVQKKDPESELWDGPRSGVDGALRLLGVDEAMEENKFESYLDKYSETTDKFILWYDFYNSPNNKIQEIMKRFISKCFKLSCESPRPLFHSLRLIKSNAEIALMKQSCEIASNAFVEVMKYSNHLETCNESDLHAKMEYECRIRGANYLAYPPVVAGGNRANIIHYINNNQQVRQDELVLMDAGCYYHGYISDITRTWPVGGKFNSAQKALYQVLHEIQNELFKLCHQRISLDKLHIFYNKLLGEKLKELGLLSNKLTDSEVYHAAQQFCPHHVSHYLGMDVHDSSVIPRSLALQTGMCFTIEPGIYIDESNLRVPKEFRGIGMRIEDDVVMTDVGPIVLSEKCPKSIRDIESVMTIK